MYKRAILTQIKQQIKKGKSILLLGPRQVGKTTLCRQFKFDLNINLASIPEKLVFERDPERLEKIVQKYKRKIIIYIDEIQKIPALFNSIQVLIDSKKAQFVLTGSSARKIRQELDLSSRKKLTKSSRYLFFDMGVRRILSGESRKFFADRKVELFEHFIGNELLKWIHISSKGAKLYFWRDSDGPEVDWLIEYDGNLLPIEVKIRSDPDSKSIRHLKTFMSEYAEAKSAIVISTTDIKYKLDKKITVIPYQKIHEELDRWKQGFIR